MCGGGRFGDGETHAVTPMARSSSSGRLLPPSPASPATSLSRSSSTTRLAKPTSRGGGTIVGPSATDHLGRAVVTSAYDGVVALAAQGNDMNGENSGRVHVYEFHSDTDNYILQGVSIERTVTDNLEA